MLGLKFGAGLVRSAASVPIRYSAGAAQMKEIVGTELDSIREAGTWKNERVITSPQAASIRVRGSQSEILNFCANNYLGLAVNDNSADSCGRFYISHVNTTTHLHANIIVA